MFIQKINKTKLFWIANLILFAGLVFLGIEQAGRGAEISHLENKLEEAVAQKRELSEKIFKYGEESNMADTSASLGFNKPTQVLYLDSEEVSLTLR